MDKKTKPSDSPATVATDTIGTVTIITFDNGRLNIKGNALDFKDMGQALQAFKASGFTHESTMRSAKIVSSVNSVLKQLNKLSNANIMENGVKLPDGTTRVIDPTEKEFVADTHMAPFEKWKARGEEIEKMQFDFTFTPISYKKLFCKQAMDRDEMPIAPTSLSWLLEFKFIVD